MSFYLEKQESGCESLVDGVEAPKNFGYVMGWGRGAGIQLESGG